MSTSVASMVPIFFYLPKKLWPPDLPSSERGFWQWQNAQDGAFRRGRYNWTLQTYLHLRAAGVPCKLVGALPKKGILIAHWDSLPDYLQPGPELLIVCIQADRPRHAYAQLHMVQNPADAAENAAEVCRRSLARGSFFIRYWPQPDLMPRSAQAEGRFLRIAHMGLPETLAPELQTERWRQRLQAMGLTWQITPPDQWHDYRQVDAILSVRSFDYQGSYLYKPASKLVNAWLAGVPAILGAESAFRAERQSELDYLEVTSPEAALAALSRLQSDPALRAAMIENGRSRSQSTTPEAITQRWQLFLNDVAMPAHADWCAQPQLRQQFFLKRRRLQTKAAQVATHWRSQLLGQAVTFERKTLDPTL